MNRETAIFRSLELIERDISEKLTVEHIAVSVHFSKFYYQRLFREIVGGSVMDYVLRRRLTLAGKALLESDASVLDIALAYGYDSHEGFSRSFKAYMGVSPTQYRKYGLTAISQNKVRERSTMALSTSTNEMIRELNGFIIHAKETAEAARKDCVPELQGFWETVADRTDQLADQLKAATERIASIANHPDEITSRFAILKAVEDAAFQANVIAFNVGLMISRSLPEHVSRHHELVRRFAELAGLFNLKAEKVSAILRDLASLIFDDMRGASSRRLEEIIQAGKRAADSITGYSYIKEEVAHLVSKLSAIAEGELTMGDLDDSLFQLDIILFAADMDSLRNPADKELFSGLLTFRDTLAEGIEYLDTLLIPQSLPVAEEGLSASFRNITFQQNILLFYLRGEVSREKLGRLLDSEQKAFLQRTCDAASECIHFCYTAEEQAAFAEIEFRLRGIVADLTAMAEQLEERGGAMAFLAGEYGKLADKVDEYTK